MNKLVVLMSLSIVLLLTFSIAQPAFPESAYDSSTGILNVKLTSGWNLIPMFGRSYSMVSNTCGDDFGAKAVYVWSPVEGKYFGPSLEPGSEASKVLARDSYSYYYAFDYGGALFMYREGPACSYSMNIGKKADINEKELSNVLSKLKIVRGWNFIILTQWMQDRSLADFIGTCELTKVFLFDAKNQKWEGGSVDKSALETSFVAEEIVGRIYAMKFANDCSFDLEEEEVIGPPPLPD